jgi:hypothetical protein
MIQDHLNKIEERLKQSEAVKESDKTELLTLLTTLRTEIADLSQTHYEQAVKRVRRFSICRLKVWPHRFRASKHLIQG